MRCVQAAPVPLRPLPANEGSSRTEPVRVGAVRTRRTASHTQIGGTETASFPHVMDAPETARGNAWCALIPFGVGERGGILGEFSRLQATIDQNRNRSTRLIVDGARRTGPILWVRVTLWLSFGSRALDGERQSSQIRARPMKALAPIDVLDFNDPLRVTPDWFDPKDAVPAVANETALDRSCHVSSSLRSPRT